MWDEVDILLTANPELLLKYPKNKIVIKFEREYNQTIECKYTIKSIKELEKTILGEYENQEELISEIVNSLYSQKDRRCAYCDTPIQVKNIESGLDRLDSSKNYLEDNLVFCCPKCNTMKYSDSPEDFINKIKSINDNIIDKTKDINLEQYL